MTKENILLEAILEYDSLINKFNTALQKTYNTQKPPLLAHREGRIPRQGSFISENMLIKFNFHGMGCRVEIGAVTLEFDYSFGDFIYKGFDSDKLFWFIKSKSIIDFEDKQVFERSLLKLVEYGMLNTNKNRCDTHDYELLK